MDTEGARRDDVQTVRRELPIAAVLSVSLAWVAATGAAAAPGKLRAGKTVSGAVAVTAVNATVESPHGIWVRFIGDVTTGTAVVACSRGMSISSNHYSYGRAGTYKVPIRPARAGSCDVIASIAGSGRVRVEIRAN